MDTINNLKNNNGRSVYETAKPLYLHQTMPFVLRKAFSFVPVLIFKKQRERERKKVGNKLFWKAERCSEIEGQQSAPFEIR